VSEELSEPPESFTELAGEYPFGLVAGGLLLGMAAGAFLPRGIGRKLAGSALTLALTAADAGRTYGQSAAQTAGKGARQSSELGKRLLDEAIKAVSKRI
jgi:hypothetical protein